MTVSELIALLQTFPPDALIVVNGPGEYDLSEMCVGDVRPVELVRYDTPHGPMVDEYRGDLDGMEGPLPGVYIA